MPQAYSDDLRRKFLQAYDQGRGALEKLAGVFGVSYGWAQKIAAARRRTGQMERPRGARRGFPSRLTAELRDQLRTQLGTQPDATLAELQHWLKQEFGVSVSISRLCTVLQEMGLPLKKSRSMPPSKTPPWDANVESSGARRSRRSRQNV